MSSTPAPEVLEEFTIASSPSTAHVWRALENLADCLGVLGASLHGLNAASAASTDRGKVQMLEQVEEGMRVAVGLAAKANECVAPVRRVRFSFRETQ